MPIDQRVLRGGAFNNQAQNVRCAYRNRNNPDNENNNNGFRVVVSTFFSPTGIGRRPPGFRPEVKEWPGVFLAGLAFRPGE